MARPMARPLRNAVVALPASALGAGSYAVVARGCEGQVLRVQPMLFRDAGIALEQRFRGPGVIGVRGACCARRSAVTRFAFPEVHERTNAYVNR